MDKRTRSFIAKGAAVLGLAAAGAAVYKNRDDEKLFALGIRRSFGKNDVKRDAGLKAPEDVVRVTDLAYAVGAGTAHEASTGTAREASTGTAHEASTGTAHEASAGTAQARSANAGKLDPEQLLDIYYLAGTAEKLPIIVSVHGGAYMYGNKEVYQYYCMSLAQKGFTVVNLNYRLAPEHKFPDQLGDINSAMKFVCRTADEYRGDLDNVFFVGDSAGAQMASQYLAAVTNAKYAQLLGLDVPEFKVRAAALNCGMYELDPVRDKMLIKCYLGSEEVMRSAKMDVLANITGDYPPCFIMTSTGDFLRGNAEPLGALLTRRGVENEVHVYGTEEEPLGHVFHCDVRNPIAAVCNEEECEFFRRHIVK